MSITIRREIEVKRKGLPVVIDVTYGTDLIQMEFKVTDCIIPAESAAVAYNQGRTAEVHKQICIIDENVISFTPEKGFFEEGRNELQLRVVHNNRSLFTFKCRVECQGSFADSDAEEVKRNSSLVEQLMTEQAVTKARLEEVLKIPEDGSDVEKAVNDIKVGADGKVYSSPGEAVRQQIGQVSEQIDELNNAFSPNESVIAANETTFVRYDNQDGIAFSFEDDGFTAQQKNNLNYNYGFIFPTEVGEEYEVTLQFVGARAPRIRVVSNWNYPNKPEVDSTDFLLVKLTDDGSGKMTGKFTADRNEASLNIYQYWDIPKLEVNNISCVKTNTITHFKEEFLPHGSKTNYGALKVGDGIDVNDGVISIKPEILKYEVVTPCVYAINGAENFELFNNGVANCSLADNEYTIVSQWVNVFAQDSCGAKGKLTINTKAGTLGWQPADISFVDKYGNKVDMSQGLKVRYANMPSIENKLNILFIGDSLVASNEYVREFGNLMDGFGLREKMEFLGRCHDTDKLDVTSRYEAVGGYAWANYVNNPTTLPSAYPNNYFWNPTTNALDIAYYFNTYCGGKAPDYIVCNVGWNQRVNPEYYNNFDFDDIEEMCNRWIDAVHSAYPNCRIILNGIHYGNPDFPYPTFRYREWGIQLTKLYDKIASEYSFVRFCDIAPYFDGRTGMPTTTRNVNRFVDEKENHITDYIHPNTIGYKMHAFADAMCLLYDYANH